LRDPSGLVTGAQKLCNCVDIHRILCYHALGLLDSGVLRKGMSK